MPLFVLKEGLRVVSTPTGGRVIHAHTGDTVDVGFEELQLLARATAGGIDANDPTLKPLVRRLAGLNLLIPAEAKTSPTRTASPTGIPSIAPILQSAQAASEGSQAPSPPIQRTSPPLDEGVPLFRGDLKLTQRPQTALYDVADPKSGKRFTLYDFEVSLARMLNGRRTYGEVIESGQRLGIPISPASLNQFIKQLERYGFLSPPGSAPPEPTEGTLWAPRERWDEGIRTMFQSGLRMSRQGRYKEAASYFEALLEQDPDNPEALELLAQVRQRLGGASASEEPSVDVALSDAPPVENEWLRDSIPVDAPAAPPARKRPSRRGLMLAVGLLLVAGAGAAAFFVLAPEPPPPVGPVPATPPKPRPTPQPAAVLEADAGEQMAAVIDAGEETGERLAEVADAGDDAGEPLAEVTDAGEDAAEPLAEVADAGEGAVLVEAPEPGFSIDKRGRVTMGQVKAAQTGLVEWAVEATQPVKKGQLLGHLEVGGKKVPFRAPKDGLLLPKYPLGERVPKGKVVAAVVYHEAFLQTVVKGVTPQKGWACEVSDSASRQRAPCKIVSVKPKAGGQFVTATVEPLWFDESAAPQLHLAPP